MATLIPTRETGATTKPTEHIYAVADAIVTAELQSEQIALDGVNVPFLADLLSAMLAHERCGVHLYRSVAGRTGNAVLKRKYEEFGAETLRHVEILEELVTSMGGSPSYVSPMARAVEGADARILESTFMLAGSLDVMTAETTMLDAVFLAESVDHANWSTMGELVSELPDGAMRDAAQRAVDEVEEQEDEHLSWARDTRAKLVKLRATTEVLPKVGATAEDLIAQVKSWFD
jgi:rubrerythrin